MSPSLATLPEELILELQRHLEPDDLASLIRVAKLFARILSSWVYEVTVFGALSPGSEGYPYRFYHNPSPSHLVEGWRSEPVVDFFAANAKPILAARDWDSKTLLHHLAVGSNYRLLDVLLKEADCTEVDVQDLCRRTPLHYAVKCKNEHAIDRLLNAGADVFVEADRQETAMMFVDPESPGCIPQNLIKAAKISGRDIFAPDRGRPPLLHNVAGRGKLDLLKLLVAYGANIFLTDQLGNTPLVFAVRYDQLAVSKYLMDAMKPSGIDIDALVVHRSPKPGSRLRTRRDTLLHLAARYGCTRMIEFLLDSGANPLVVNRTDGPGKTAFDRVVKRGRSENIQTMLAKTRPPPKFWTSNGYLQKEFDKAVVSRNTEVVQFLLDLREAGKADIDINSSDSPGTRPIMEGFNQAHRLRCMGKSNSLNRMTAKLVAVGLDVNIRNEYGKNLLHVILSLYIHGDSLLDSFRCILAAGVDWRQQDNDGNTALHLAAGNGLASFVEHILSITSPGDAGLNVRNRMGRTALHLAVNFFGIHRPRTIHPAKQLLDAGLDPNAMDNEGKSPLHMTGHNPGRFVRDMEALIAAGADLCLKDNDGNPPIHHAADLYEASNHCENWERTVKYFVEAGADLHHGCQICDAVIPGCRSSW